MEMLDSGMHHIVVDTETLGTKPGCIVLSIGAASFQLSSNDHKYFHDTINKTSCKDEGLVAEPETVKWWEEQSAAARNATMYGTSTLLDALIRFSDFIQSFPSKEVFCIWGNSPSFDLSILRYCYEDVFGMQTPWDFRQERCFRTVKSLVPSVPVPPFEGIKHTAMADAMHEARHLKEILGLLRGEGF